MIGLGKASKGLYLLQQSPPPSSVLAASSQIPISIPSVSNNSVNNVDLWHFRLGHPSYAKLSLPNKFVFGLNSNNKATCCDICHFAKQKRLSFPNSSHVSHCLFDLVHCDL